MTLARDAWHEIWKAQEARRAEEKLIPLRVRCISLNGDKSVVDTTTLAVEVDSMDVHAIPTLTEAVAGPGAHVPVDQFKFLCALHGLPTPVSEHKFHPKRRWRFDYAWPDKLTAVEIDGGIWRKGGGAHSRPSNILRDMEKINAAVLLGWRVLRFTPDRLIDAVNAVRLLHA